MSIALAATGCVADPPAAHKVSRTQTAEGLGPAVIPSDLHGKTVQLTYESGSGGTATFADDGRSLTYVAADTGRRTTSPVAIEPVETGIFLVTWTDDGNGAVISQVQDYRTGRLQGTWTQRADASAPYAIESRTGSVHLTD
ncbi:MoaF-related domain-containing protein [Nocardia jejuensis]|uniref:MoaF-related domain-containing protein n=1 Tax=Nocardia jejuensis TaxID=328049 RepID=UPI00082B40D4|nr:MoaF N-terminal domain-containing protein [Nocardia jejuensis]